jgi:hypothetical protein
VGKVIDCGEEGRVSIPGRDSDFSANRYVQTYDHRPITESVPKFFFKDKVAGA